MLIFLDQSIGRAMPSYLKAVKAIQEHRTYLWQVQNVNTAVLDQVPPQVRIVPTKFRQAGGWGMSNNRVLGIGQPVKTLLLVAYGGISPFRVVLPTNLPEGNYDFIANLPNGSAEAL